MADHYAVIQRATGKALEPPKLPAALRYLWHHFVELHRTRSSNGFGPNPISWTELLAYCQLTRNPLDWWEVEAIKRLDEAFLEQAASE